MYKYAVPRGYAELNLGQYLIVSGEFGAARESFTQEQIERIRDAVSVIPFADYIYAMCYLGFRPSELLALSVDNYDANKKTLTGGAKTEAGKIVSFPSARRSSPLLIVFTQEKRPARCSAMKKVTNFPMIDSGTLFFTPH